jgi:hypothetical protein
MKRDYICYMRKVFLSVFCSLFSVFCLGQSWQPVGGGTDSEVVGFVTFKGLLYVGGRFHNVGGNPANCIATWNGTKWDSVGSGIKTWSNGGIGAFAIYDSVLFGAGQFYEAGNDSAKSIAQWNGTTWDSVGAELIAMAGQNVVTVALYNKEIYAGGSFIIKEGGKTFNFIARWNGINWDSVGSGFDNIPWYASVVYNGKLYVGGYFTHAGGISANYIACWDGTKWDSVGNGLNNAVHALTIYNGNLYAAGLFTTAGGIPVNHIAKWDGIKWDSLGKGTNGNIEALAVYNGRLIVGGYFDSAEGKPAGYIASWDGANWNPIGIGLSSGHYGVWCLGVYDSTLYAGGDFTKSGSVTDSNIAMWSGPLGMNIIDMCKPNVKVYPNPSDGKFTIESSVVSGKSLVEIYNVLGEKIYNETLRQVQGDNQIDLSNQTSGIYLYRVVSEKGELIGSGKLIIQ